MPSEPDPRPARLPGIARRVGGGGPWLASSGGLPKKPVAVRGPLSAYNTVVEIGPGCMNRIRFEVGAPSRGEEGICVLRIAVYTPSHYLEGGPVHGVKSLELFFCDDLEPSGTYF